MKNKVEQPKVVVIGGGSGSSVVLRGLKSYTPNLTAVVTMFDSGGSSGLLQQEFGFPPLGDLRQCLLGLSEDSEATRSLRELIGFRFQRESSLQGHSLGNLLLAAMTTIAGKDLERAIEEMAELLRISGQVLPVALQRADLCARLEDGRLLRGESKIDLRGECAPRIKEVYLDPGMGANPRAVAAIREAEVVVLGPGDLFTSIIPNLLVGGIAEALAESKATRIYVCNLMTKLGETDDFRASDFVGQILKYLKGPHLDWALINTRSVSAEVREAYVREGAYPVEGDVERVRGQVRGVFATALHNNQAPLKHDAEQISEAVLSIARIGRPLGQLVNGRGYRRESPPLPEQVAALRHSSETEAELAV